MRHSKVAAAILFTSAVMAAAPAHAQYKSTRNPSLTSVNQPVVQRTDYVIDLASTGSGFPASELGRLEGWLDTIQLGYGDRLYVDEGGYRDVQSRRQVSDLAAKYGMLLSEGAPVTAGSAQPGTVRIIVSRASASVPGCPNWQDAGDYGARISTSTNYGCAMNSNLAAMIADPNDLVLGQTGEVGGDAATTSKAIDAYRRRVPTGLNGTVKAESTGGK